MLKADITKAFDKLEWAFLYETMKYLNVPTTIADLMMYAFRHAKVTIQVNREGDGFINPTRGLRQGCPMSPYCFIMVMEMLTRQMQLARSRDLIRGVQLAPQCPTLTHVVYADDLILLGEADDWETRHTGRVMQQFGDVSGLIINPTKSKLWFSRRCTNQQIQMVMSTFKAAKAGSEEKYLGALISGRNSAKQTGLMLLEKLKAKLTGWRANMLSHAGRLVLIKAVLMSIPVYYMSLEVLPIGLIRQMESLIAKFFWGKVDKDRYLTFISWGRICQPIEKGGLGVRQLKVFGDALFMKLVWALMSNENKIWVQVCRGKYFNNLGFWRAVQVSGTSQLWRQTVKMRDFFKQRVSWQLANGEGVEVLSQPWYPQWSVAPNASRADRRVKVAELFNAESNAWKKDDISALLGDEAVGHIEQHVQAPKMIPGMKDQLVWDYIKSGNYTVKEGYNCVISGMQVQGGDVQWRYIWSWKMIVPKVRLFIWRLMTNTLPIAQNLNTRIHAISPMCQRCNQENEFATHCFFFCHGSRMVWFRGELGLRTHDLPINMVEAVQQLTQGMNEENIATFCYTLWEIWLARNEAVLQHKPFQPIAVCMKVVAWKKRVNVEDTVAVPMSRREVPHEYLRNGWQIIVDASWDTSHKSGIAFLVYHAGMLQWMVMKSLQAQDPFQAEAIGLQEVMTWIKWQTQQFGPLQAHIFSDCMNLIDAVQEGNIDELPSWRAVPIVAEIINEVQHMGSDIMLQHVRREAVRPAHDMANKARRSGTNYQGMPAACLMCEHGIGMQIEDRFFQQVQEAPP
ncbi:hypothetical protein LUZ61_016213 [Rhynchospora tenuis]|uniref:Reverse transcriptase domain-containing protein n=1 Tax=Rhynchospora tenuis TaxID=198213 RepID=A0AAD6EJV6_9POAL|nr:hypothetical protein LUZ61_016213 [Rhynchospora tenuis]